MAHPHRPAGLAVTVALVLLQAFLEVQLPMLVEVVVALMVELLAQVAQVVAAMAQIGQEAVLLQQEVMALQTLVAVVGVRQLMTERAALAALA